MDPNVWGPKFWFSLHSVSMTYPFYPDEADKHRYKSFYELLEYVLPCVLCRVNYSKNIRSHPIDKHLQDRKSLVNWVLDVHNMVNVENGKPTMTLNELLNNYQTMFGRQIFLEDPEPNVTKKKLDDSVWQKNREKQRQRTVGIVQSGGLFFAILFFVVILALIAFLMNKKIS